MSDNWIINNLNGAFETWNEKLGEIWQLVSQSPQVFKGGGIWEVILTINGALKAIGYALLILFFAMSVFGGTMSFKDFKSWQTALRYFLRFVVAKAAVTYGMDILTAIFSIAGGTVNRMADSLGSMSSAMVTLPDTIDTAVRNVGFFESIPLWIVTLLGSLLIWALSLIMIFSVYGRFFRLYLLTALAPLPLSTFAGESSSRVGKAFLKSYAGVCLEGAVVIVCCVIFGAFSNASTLGIPDPSLPAVTIVWNYIGEVVFNMLVLVGLIKGSDRIVKEIMRT